MSSFLKANLNQGVKYTGDKMLIICYISNNNAVASDFGQWINLYWLRCGKACRSSSLFHRCLMKWIYIIRIISRAFLTQSDQTNYIYCFLLSFGLCFQCRACRAETTFITWKWDIQNFPDYIPDFKSRQLFYISPWTMVVYWEILLPQGRKSLKKLDFCIWCL